MGFLWGEREDFFVYAVEDYPGLHLGVLDHFFDSEVSAVRNKIFS